MTVISTVILHPNGHEVIGDFFTSAQKAVEAVGAIEGVESIVFSSVTIGGPQTNSFALQTTIADWETFGKVQAKLSSDPELIALLMDAGQICTWETYVGQEIDFSLIPG